MTLDTRIYILGKTPVRDLFRRCQEILTGFDEDRRGPEQQQWSDEQDKSWRGGEPFVEPGNPWTIENLPGQGLPAWLMLYYRPGAPLRTEAEASEHDEDCESDCDGRWHRVACWAEISFDTSYSYRGANGMGCGDLHAAIVGEVGKWLDERGARWRWKNESTGEIHEGYESLVELMAPGFEASAWFSTSVLPAILAHHSED